MINNKKPLISVVIPAFNEEKYLPACLDAFRKQTFKNYELIVVDNNSTDKTAAIAKKYGARVIRENKQGMIPARERGFRESQANFIARTDADTIVTPNWLEVIYKTFKSKPGVVAMTGPFLSPTKKIPHKIISGINFLYNVKFANLISKHIYLQGANMAVRKSAWIKIKVNSDDKKVHEDVDLSYHLSKVGKIIYNTRQKVYFSFRRITSNPKKGLTDWLGEYPLRLIKTLYYNKVGIFRNINNSDLHRH